MDPITYEIGVLDTIFTKTKVDQIINKLIYNSNSNTNAATKYDNASIFPATSNRAEPSRAEPGVDVSRNKDI
jgi:hypothetical protein